MKKNYLSILLFLFVFRYTASAQITLTVATTTPSCFPLGDASATVTATGGVAPYSYSLGGVYWQSSNILTNLGGGLYVVNVKDASGDTASAEVNILNGPELPTTFSSTATTCFGGPGGTITVAATAGVGPYKYILWNYDSDTIIGAQATFIPHPPNVTMSANTYTIEVIDQVGCTAIDYIDVPNGDSLRAVVTTRPPSCTGVADGYGQFDIPNVTDPFTISDFNQGISYSLTNASGEWEFSPGNYSWWILDAAGCEGMVDMVVPFSTTAFTNAGHDTAVCAGASIQLSGSDNGHLVGEAFQWSPATGLSNSQIANPLVTPAASTSYVLTTFSNWALGPYCITRDTITITVVNITTPLIEYAASILSVTNIQPGVTYTWQQLSGTAWTDIATGSSYSVTANADYRVKASNGGCEQFSPPVTAGRASVRNPFAIAMYPNPATNVLVLTDLKLTDHWQTLEIINYQGHRMSDPKNISNETDITVNVSALTTGVYIARLRKEGGKTVELRFLKK